MRFNRSWVRAKACGLPPLTVLLLVLTAVSHAEQLPIKAYTTADGLAHDHINRIHRDSRGFLWICTDEGLSRFDGYAFISYTTADGLPHQHVNDLLETRDGAYWIATDGGLCRFNPKGSKVRHDAGEPMFTAYSGGASAGARVINTLMEDGSGSIWCGTNDGLYLLNQSTGEVKLEAVDIALPRKTRDDSTVNSIIVDRTGAFWVGTHSGLYRWTAAGPAEWYMLATDDVMMKPSMFSDDHTKRAGGYQSVNRLLEDRNGRIWVGTRDAGLFRVSLHDATQPVIERISSGSMKLPHRDIRSLCLSSDGTLWVGSVGGLSKLIDSTGTRGNLRVLNYTTANGLSESEIYEVTEAEDNSLWIGTHQSGVMRMALRGLATYGEADHFRPSDFNSILETLAGELCATGGDYSYRFMQCFDGKKFRSAWPKLPKQVIAFGWGWNQTTFQDHVGEWWVATAAGLFRFPKVKRIEDLEGTLPRKVYTVRDGLPWNNISRLYEDSHGDIWIATDDPAGSLSRWERSTDKIRTYSELGLSSSNSILPTAFREDASGDLWIGYRGNGGLVRRRNGRFTRFSLADGIPGGSVNSLYIDRANRLWIASSEGGLARLDDPSADRLHFVRYTTSEGLSSNEIWSVTEDVRGRIYVSTGRGIDRIDSASIRVTHYTEGDGLAKGGLRVSLRDRRGALWFVTTRGISRLTPDPEPASRPPSILIDRLRISGVKYPVSEVGETQIGGLDLRPGPNDIEISYVGLHSSLGAKLQYQYRLQDVDQAWSVLTEQRTVNYASLPAGAYIFEVRAVNPDGVASPSPARVAFRIQPHIWQRAWFITLAGFWAGCLIYGAHRYHVGRVVALEQVRARIAMDLHDDIGSSLSRVAILSEVVNRQVGSSSGESSRLLLEIANSARELVDGMSDIVWSIDPRRDDLGNLASRVRQFASEILEGKGIRWDFQTPLEPEKLKLGPEQRRHVFLIFKEAINNIARHANCGSVSLVMDIARDQFVGEIHDDGCGFATDESSGHGLANMQRRAAELHGELQVCSAPLSGTRVTLRFPLKATMA